MSERRLPVTLPFLPPIAEYKQLLDGIWERNHLTNQGPLVRQLEADMAAFLEIDQPLHCVANGGLGIQIALKALGIGGKAITTPFSYIATTSCPRWEGLEVLFADIDREGFGLDPASIEARIEPGCEAILATHVFGNACDIEGLQKVADRHGLALIFDSAHAFGSRYNNRSLIDYGDLSIVSTHATKVFHTVEGGFVTGQNRDALAKVEWMRRFGHDGEEAFHGAGINAKLSELHAAAGLSILPYFSEIQKVRASICHAYDTALADAEGVAPALQLRPGLEWNHSYYPVLFDTEEILLERVKQMNEANIFPRRYFYPTLDHALSIPDSSACPVADDIAKRILCLPLHHQMTRDDADSVLNSATPPAAL